MQRHSHAGKFSPWERSSQGEPFPVSVEILNGFETILPDAFFLEAMLAGRLHVIVVCNKFEHYIFQIFINRCVVVAFYLIFQSRKEFSQMIIPLAAIIVNVIIAINIVEKNSMGSFLLDIYQDPVSY